jgi:hypothetical protein
MIYMRQSVSYDRTGVVSKLVIAAIITGLSLLVLIAKVVIAILFYRGSGEHHQPSEDNYDFYKSFGYTFEFYFKSDPEALVHGIETYGPDLLALIFGTLLVLYAKGHLVSLKEESEDDLLEDMDIKGVRSYKFWAWVVLFFLSVSGLLLPNFIALSFIVLSSICMYFWALGYSIEGGVFRVVSFLSMSLAFLYVMAVFILRIEYLKGHNEENWEFILGLTWADPNG